MSRVKFSWLVFIGTLVLYLFSMAPSIASEESASWVVNSLMSGLPDAPGNLLYLLVCSFFYHVSMTLLAPVLNLLARLVFLISTKPSFIFEPASAVNLISVFSGAGAAALTFGLLDRASAVSGAGSRLGERGKRLFIAAATLFLFSLPALWGASLQAGPEIFNVLLLVLSLWILVRIQEGSLSAATGILVWACLLGLSFSQSFVPTFSILALVAFWRWDGRVRQALAANFVPALIVFVVGLSLYIYLAVRPVIDPGLGQPIDLFSRRFWVYFYGLDPLRHSLPRAAGLFSTQLPLLAGGFAAQAPHWSVALLLLGLFLYSLIRMFLARKRLFFWSFALLLSVVLIQLWLINPKPGPHQTMGEAGGSVARDLGDLNSRILISYLFYGVWAMLGLAWLKDDCTRLLSWLVRRSEFTERNLGWLPGAGQLTVVCLLLVSPLWFNWHRTSLAKDFVTLDYARNMFAGTQDKGILIVSSDKEFYPVMYVKHALYSDSSRSVLNYNYLVDPAYIKSLGKVSPPVARNYTDQQVESLRPARLAEPYDFKAGKLELRFPQGTLLLIRDLAVIDIVRANVTNRPLYFSGSLGIENMAGFDRFLVRRGLAVQLLDQDPLLGPDSSYFWTGADKIVIDINYSSHLLWLDYRYHTTVKDIPASRKEQMNTLFGVARVYSMLADAFLMRNNKEQAALNFRQTEFFDPEYKDRLFMFASWFARERQYDVAKQFTTEYFKDHPADALKWTGLAKMALDRADTTAAADMLVEAVKVDPDFQLGFTKLVRLYDATDQKLMAQAILSRWVARHADDQQARKLWEQYSATKTLPPDFPD